MLICNYVNDLCQAFIHNSILWLQCLGTCFTVGSILPTLQCIWGVKLWVTVWDSWAIAEYHQCGTCNIFQDRRRLHWITVAVRLTQFELEDKTNPIAPLPIYLQPQTWHQCKYLQCPVSWAGDGSCWQWRLMPVPLWLYRLTSGKRVSSLTMFSLMITRRYLQNTRLFSEKSVQWSPWT